MNIIALFIVFLLSGWDCIHQFILQVDGAGRIPFWLSFLFLIVLIASDKKSREILFAKPMSWQWVLCIYTVLNTLRIGISPLIPSVEIFCYYAMTPFLLFTYIYLVGRLEPKRCLTTILCSMYMSCLIYITKTGMHEWGSGQNSALRLSSETLNSNFLSFYAVAAFFVLLLYRAKYGMNKLIFFAGSGLSALIVFLTMSRTGYVCFFILLAFAFVHKIKLTFAKFIGGILLLVLLYFANNWIMGNTDMGYRFSMREYESARAVYATDTILDDIFGERIVYVVLLMELFPQYPCCGIGTYNFILYNQINNCVCHNEFIRYLTEGGLIGFSLFVIFLFLLWKQLFLNLRKYPEMRSSLLLCLGGMLSVFFAYMGSFSMPPMQIMLAVAASEIFSDELSSSNMKENRIKEICNE